MWILVCAASTAATCSPASRAKPSSRSRTTTRSASAPMTNLIADPPPGMKRRRYSRRTRSSQSPARTVISRSLHEADSDVEAFQPVLVVDSNTLHSPFAQRRAGKLEGGPVACLEVRLAVEQQQ